MFLLVEVILQQTVVEVNQLVNWHILGGTLILKNSLDGLLHLSRRLALVVLRRSFRHIQVQLDDVVELVSWVQVAQALRNPGVLRGRSLESDCRLRSF